MLRCFSLTTWVWRVTEQRCHWQNSSRTPTCLLLFLTYQLCLILCFISLAAFQLFTYTEFSNINYAYQRILVITATNQNGQNRNGHKPKRPQTGTATNRSGHKPKRPPTKTVINRNGHKPERPQIEIDKTISDSPGYKCECSIEVSN